jgi:hypothetical protein
VLSVISLVVAVFGLLGLLFSLRQSYRARLRQFEEKYVERYWSILDELSLEALSLSDSDPDRNDERAIRRYILLCEDELQMRKSGYISDSTYEEWVAGMRDQLTQPMFKAVWERVKKEGISEEDDGAFPYANLRHLLAAQNYKSGGSGDPLQRRAPLRVIRGLKGIGGV